MASTIARLVLSALFLTPVVADESCARADGCTQDKADTQANLMSLLQVGAVSHEVAQTSAKGTQEAARRAPVIAPAAEIKAHQDQSETEVSSGEQCFTFTGSAKPSTTGCYCKECQWEGQCEKYNNGVLCKDKATFETCGGWGCRWYEPGSCTGEGPCTDHHFQQRGMCENYGCSWSSGDGKSCIGGKSLDGEECASKGEDTCERTKGCSWGSE